LIAPGTKGAHSAISGIWLRSSADDLVMKMSTAEKAFKINLDRIPEPDLGSSTPLI
jgi:hypothetical protein